MKQYIEAMFQESSLGALMKAHSIPALDAKEMEAAVKVIYTILFNNKVPHNRKAEIMKYSIWESKAEEIQKACKKISDDELAIVARFFGTQSCTREDLARFLVAPTSTAISALRAGPAPMEED
jgi:hypothetical protein